MRLPFLIYLNYYSNFYIIPKNLILPLFLNYKEEITLMKFIISRYSPKMIQAKDFDLKWHELSEDEFQALALDAYSCIGAEDVAALTGYAYNKESVRARPGDILLLADWDNGKLVYYCIQVLESETPLFREEELEYLEELI